MKLHTVLGLLLATAALSACDANKGDGTKGTSDSAIEPAPPAAEIIPPSAEPSPEAAIESTMEKAGTMMKEGAEDVIDDAKEKAKEVITN